MGHFFNCLGSIIIFIDGYLVAVVEYTTYDISLFLIYFLALIGGLLVAVD